MSIRIFITGGTFDKEYNELDGRLYFRESHVEDILKRGRCSASVNIETLMMVDSLDMSAEQRQIIVDECLRAAEDKIVITHGTDTMTDTARLLAEQVKAKTIVLTGALVPYRFNHIMQTPGYAEGFVTGMIYREMVAPKELHARQSNTIPDWKKLEQQIRKKYNAAYADRVILGSRTAWARSHKEYADYTKCLTLQMDKQYITPSSNNPIADLAWNNLAWEIFLYSRDSSEMEKALEWSMNAIRIVPDPNSFDTYASLLYKLGRKEKAIIWQQTAIKLNPDNAEQKQKLEAMKRGEPIWPDLQPAQKAKN